MKLSLLPSLVFLLLILLIDLYAWQAFRTATQGSSYRKAIFYAYWGFTVFSLCLLLAGGIISFSRWPTHLRIYLPAVVLIVYISKLVILPFLATDDLIRLVKWVQLRFSDPVPPKPVASGSGMTRNEFISQAALLFAGVPFVALIYGMVYGAFDYKVRRIAVRSRRLPQAFNGLRILQISDIHAGSFADSSHLEEAVKMINAQKADMVVFTGDLVNNITTEVYPYMDILRRITAPMGVFSILGNHDYGDYVPWPSPEAKQANMQDMEKAHKDLGWRLLLDDHAVLERGGDRIILGGCQNWGALSRFPKYGRLDKTFEGVPQDLYTILLSHDPSHWDAQIRDNPHFVDLTLSGHTHGMQFGVDTKWLKWSPVQYFYKQWAGLYSRDNKSIYVNCGLGFLGYPGRAGIRPEITVLELVTRDS